MEGGEHSITKVVIAMIIVDFLDIIFGIDKFLLILIIARNENNRPRSNR
jgi:hypothetical protein